MSIIEILYGHGPSELRKNKYIQSATLDGKPWNKPWLEHQDLMKGGKLEFVMGKMGKC